jgi:predicted ATP-grasp superfamily ATP-dependent carboligase
LQKKRFSGIAEVEYKWDAADGQYKLIEINPRPWDQHRLGNSCGINLMYIAYCELAGLPKPAVRPRVSGQKWIAEDVFFTTGLQLLWRRDRKFRSLLRLARGQRIYAIWSVRDPLPLLAYLVTRFIPELLGSGLKALWAAFKKRLFGNFTEKGPAYERHLKTNTPN